MSTDSKTLLVNKLTDVTVALSELLMLVEKDKVALNMFEESVKATGALSTSLDDFIAEWQAVVNNALLDRQALFNTWKKSAKFYRELSEKTREEMHLVDVSVEGNDLVFEDGSYITCGIIKNNITKSFEIRFYVEIGRDCVRFTTFDEAAEYLWNTHAKVGYGL